MTVEDIIEKVKEFVGAGNFEKAFRFVDEHKDELGEQYEKVKGMISPEVDAASVVDKVKNLFH